MKTVENLISPSRVKRNIKRIGLFDSGVGGLTIVAPLMQQFNAEYVYVADNRYMPYGNKPASYIIQRAVIIVQFLIDCDVDLIIIACNAAYCSAYQQLQDLFPQITLISIVDPIIPYVINQTVNKKVGILATQATINSRLYRQKLYALDKNLTLFEQACLGLALSIEQDNKESIDTLLLSYTREMIDNEVDTILLACTHYGLIIEKIRTLVPSAHVLSIHEHTRELITSLASRVNFSTLSLFMSDFSKEYASRVQGLFPELMFTTIAPFTH